jgi:pleuromutilin/lincosamide/streptogramin A transport system ATP-binding/permease protein
MMLLEATNVKLYIKDRLLIDVAHLQIQRNDRIGLVGRNGSGKTNLLNVLAGSKSPEEGSVIRHAANCELLPQLKRTATTKSGGEVTQEYIKEALNKDPEILLADEPTTNLDTEHIEWLEKKLMNWQGALVIVSHDRTFLDSLCKTIWEIKDGLVKVYKGNYSDYLEQKESELRQEKSAFEKYEKKKKQLEEALELKIKKAEKATKAPKKVSNIEAKKSKPYYANKQKKLQKTANAIETRIEKLEKVEKFRVTPPINMNIPNEETFKDRIVLRVEDVSEVIGRRVLWESARFHIRGGDKLAIIGPNGSGKTTLVEKIIQRDAGISISPSMKIGYFSQNLDILSCQKSILENVS